MPTCFSAAHAEICLQLAVLGQFEKARERLGGRHRVARRSPILKFGQVLVPAQTAPFLLAQTLLVLGYPITALEASPSSLDTARQRSGPIM
jgi:hypothetical protein